MAETPEFPRTQLTVPFKPFTPDEVHRITGCDIKTVAFWFENLQVAYKGDLGLDGFDYMGAFAVFCGKVWLEQGASAGRASAVVNFLAHVKQEVLEFNLNKGLAYPAIIPVGGNWRGMFEVVPDLPLARKLDLRMLYGEFKKRLKDWEESYKTN